MQRAAADYEARTQREPIAPLYRYDHEVRGGSDLHFDGDRLSLRGYAQPVALDLPNPYPDMV